jgi:hypothetical protein
MRYFLAGLLLASLAASAPLLAQAFGGGGGGDGIDGGNATTLDSIDSTGFCRLANTTGALCALDNTDGTADITAPANDILELRTSGTGSITLATDSIGLAEEGGTVRNYIVSTSSGAVLYGNTDTIVLIDGTNQGTWIGDRNNQTASEIVGGIADVISAAAFTETPLLTVYGSGLTSAPAAAVQTCDCGTTGTPNTVTCDITSKLVRLTDGDADDCTVTFATTTADLINEDLIGVRIVVDSVGGGGAFNLADQAGIMELTAAFAMGVNDSLIVSYYAGALDAWQEDGRNNL